MGEAVCKFCNYGRWQLGFSNLELIKFGTTGLWRTYGDDPIPFFIASWFMYPPMKKVLVPKGNLMKFIGDYDVIFQNPEKNDADLWRVFGRDYQNSVSSFLEKTTLQRNLKEWLLKGNHLGYGIEL